MAPGGVGNGSGSFPFGRIQDALNAARPGDVITVAPGTYAESLSSVRGGSPDAPITLRAAAAAHGHRHASGPHPDVSHAYLVVDGLVLDGQYAADDTVRVTSSGDFLVLRNTEVRRSSKDLIDMAAPEGVLIEGSLLHHALNAAGGRTDAHGIVAGAVRDLTIRATEIHTFSGDGAAGRPGPCGAGLGSGDDRGLEDLAGAAAGAGERLRGGRRARRERGGHQSRAHERPLADHGPRHGRVRFPGRVHQQHGGVQLQGVRRRHRGRRHRVRLGDRLPAARAGRRRAGSGRGTPSSTTSPPRSATRTTSRTCASGTARWAATCRARSWPRRRPRRRSTSATCCRSPRSARKPSRRRTCGSARRRSSTPSAHDYHLAPGCSQIPKVGAACGNPACADLCGGREVTRVPTAIVARTGHRRRG